MTETHLLKGKPLADTLRQEISAEIARLKAGGVMPLMAVIVASADPAAIKYAEAKQRAAEKLGIEIDLIRFDPSLGQAALETLVAELSGEARVHGILLELPLAGGLKAEPAIGHIDPEKDVDGLTAANLGLIAAGNEAAAIAPATPLACIRLAESAAPLAGRRAVVIGRGRSVGRALIPMLINRDATVTICHTKTPDLRAAIDPCDFVFVAAGRAGLIGGDHLRDGQIVIDAGINVVADGAGGEKMVGDVDAAGAIDTVAALSPVPGGVGPLTSTIVFANLMRAIALQRAAADRA
ncbi:MAG: bifunctional 5,10-methylenetetrahydrofolate dehydrogenase/5,10-methenyltetrahydrofolate cyclohydrolase [Inquilinus sp.]|nr:bifunctional 5,10-methylenetetrahydrofolate dehydrogenase/5,10-methenyltetrahydrofolate cyclohydrolase [Inquilinus sp.]